MLLIPLTSLCSLGNYEQNRGNFTAYLLQFAIMISWFVFDVQTRETLEVNKRLARFFSSQNCCEALAFETHYYSFLYKLK